ncbi:MAG TPA: basic secretory protein-like protein [Polyangiaceae bacterium]|nr:basic secretory protein-like protein [Polyangiaceae bacterium]
MATLLAGASGGCSSGESGLVLGRPLQDGRGGLSGAGAGGGSVASGGTVAALGGEPGAPDAGAPSALPEAGGAGGDTGDTTDPPWVGERCTPTVEYSVHDTTPQGDLFKNAIPMPARVLWQAAHAACRLLYRDGSEVPDITTITLIVEDAPGIASTSGTTIKLSTPYLKQQSDAGVDLTQEITGILHFATSLVYQNHGSSGDSGAPSWLVVGISDYVRLESGYIDRATRMKGGTYNGGSSQSTAFFLDYLATKDADIVYELNRELSPTSPAWSNDVFVKLLGSDVDTLWTEYQSTL